MIQVNMLEAKTDLSRLVKMLETGQEDVIYIARNNQVIVDMKLHDATPATARIGVAKGKFTVPDAFDQWDGEVAGLFGGDV